MDRQLRTGGQHADHGEGLDFYNVGTGRGVGGLGIWHDNKFGPRATMYGRAAPSAGPKGGGASPWTMHHGARRCRAQRVGDAALYAASGHELHAHDIDAAIRPSGGDDRGGRRFETSDRRRAARQDREGSSPCPDEWWGPTDPAKGGMAAAIMVDPRAFAGFAEDADNYLIPGTRHAPGSRSSTMPAPPGIAGSILRRARPGKPMSMASNPIFPAQPTPLRRW
ncbi:hypothetical protein DdX_22042 [Ditylenchus destructor]|uniref:Uncharacterized protein n=1 Tax=Ditylenchus destructor TaxID=166010 RepID=A0AAD4QUR1_9BILA|nr:hypothetical protein DdX_22042 [Ditylenchus destructor]